MVGSFGSSTATGEPTSRTSMTERGVLYVKAFHSAPSRGKTYERTALGHSITEANVRAMRP